MKCDVVMLAAGLGTRMNTKHAKVSHKILDKSMIEWVYDAFKLIEVENFITVVNHKEEEIKEILKDKTIYARQEELTGTATAVKSAVPYLKSAVSIITVGDAVGLKKESIEKALKFHLNNKNDITVLTAILETDNYYGRIVRDEYNLVEKIVEVKEADKDELNIKEINSGIYIINTNILTKYINEINNDNNKKEFYFTDIIKLTSKNHRVDSYVIEYFEMVAPNDRRELLNATNILKKRIIDKHLKNGVTIISEDNTYIGDNVVIGNDTIIYPNTFIFGNTTIGSDCIIGPGSFIDNKDIPNNTIINM